LKAVTLNLGKISPWGEIFRIQGWGWGLFRAFRIIQDYFLG